MAGGTIQAARIALRPRARVDAKSSDSDGEPADSDASGRATSAAASTTHFRITAKASARSTTSRSRSRVLQARRRRARGDRRPATSTTATARRSSSRPIRAGVHLLDAPAAQLPVVEAARLARHRPARRRATTSATCASSSARCRAVMAQRAAVRVLPRGRGSVRRRSARRPAADAGTACGGATGWSSTRSAQPDVPLVITLAGGYARRVEDTVEIHAATIEEAIRHESTSSSRTISSDAEPTRASERASARSAVFRSTISPRARPSPRPRRS